MKKSKILIALSTLGMLFGVGSVAARGAVESKATTFATTNAKILATSSAYDGPYADAYIYFSLSVNDYATAAGHDYAGLMTYFNIADYNFKSNILFSDDNENYIPYSSIAVDVDYFVNNGTFRVRLSTTPSLWQNANYTYVKVLAGCEFPSFNYCKNGTNPLKYIQQETTISRIVQKNDSSLASGIQSYTEYVEHQGKTITGIAPGWNNDYFPSAPGYRNTILCFGTFKVDYFSNNLLNEATNRAASSFDIGKNLKINGVPIYKIREQYPLTSVDYAHGYNYFHLQYPDICTMHTNEILVPTIEVSEKTDFVDAAVEPFTIQLIVGRWSIGEKPTMKLANPINIKSYMPNANHLLNRSQPPFFTRAVYEFWKYTNDDEVIKRYVDTIIKEHKFWKEKRTRKYGLNSYYVTDTEEMTLIHYRGLCDRVQEYSDDKNEQLRIGVEIMSIAESGLDFNIRFKTDKSNIASSDFIHLDLNCLLYDAEVKLAEMLQKIGRLDEANEYRKRAKVRKELINKYFLTEDGIYLDYNFINGTHSVITSAASLYPYTFGISDDAKGAKKVYDLLMLKHGITVCPYRGEGIYYQWDYPIVWGEMNILSYWAMKNAHLDKEAKEIKKRFMETVEAVFKKTGKIYEKYDGNTGDVSNAEYEAPEMMGWTAAAYTYFLSEND